MNDLISRQAAIDAIVTWTVEDRPDIEMPTDLIDRIGNLPSAQQWIPVSERLPDYEEKVLCWMACDDYKVGFRDNQYGLDIWITGEFASETFDVIAWMPLPEPYKEVEL